MSDLHSRNRVTPGARALLAGLFLTLAASFAPTPASAQTIVISPLSPATTTIDQNSLLYLSATVHDTPASPAPFCGSDPFHPTPCNWTWTLTGSNASVGTTDNPSQHPYGVGSGSGGLFASQFSPGVYTITVTRAYLPPATLQVTVNPLVITLSGQQQVPQGETTRITATLAGMALGGGTDLDVAWTLGGGGSQVPDSPCTSCYTQATSVTAGFTAGTYLLTARSVKEPSVSASRVLTVLPPPVASITPASAVLAAAPGNQICFTGSAINTSSNDFSWSFDDADGGINTPSAAVACFSHRAGLPGGVFHVQARSAAGGTAATATYNVIAASLAPASVVVLAGSSRQFLAEVTGSPQAVQTQWSTTVPGGQVSVGGLLRVPPGTPAGTYAVAVQTVASPVVSATAAVTVATTLGVKAVALSPARSVIDSGQQEPFAAVVLDQNGEPHPNQAVTWSVTGPAAAAVSAAGLFTAPATPGVYQVKAVSQADATRSATATVTVGEDLMVAPSWASLAPGASRQFWARVTGVANPAVTWSVAEGAAGGTLTPAGLYTAPATAGTYHVVAVSTASGAAVSGLATVVVGAMPQLSLAVSPAEAVVARGAALQLAATVLGAADAAVSWSATAGSIDASGRFTAPAIPGTVTVTATSHADPRIQAVATVVVSDAGPSQPFQYDANGNLLADGLRTYEWDAENRLTAINLGTHRSEFGYDGMGRRAMIVESEGGAVVSKRHYLWAGHEIAEERDATATSATLPRRLARVSTARPAVALPAIAAVAVAEAAVVRAAATAAGDNAAFVSQSVPSSMVAGSAYSVAVTLTNSGTTTWTAAGNYRLGSSNPQNNGTWGLGRVYLAAGESVAPGQQKTFTFTVTAPATPGTYNFQWQLVQENVAWIGVATPNVAVSVLATTQLAQFVSQSVPASVNAGDSVPVTVVLKNTGTAVWTAASSYRLGSSNPQNNATWVVARVYLGAQDSIAQGQVKTFSFQVTAPSTPGLYNFQWQMLQENVAWFGDLTPNLQIQVVVPVEPVLTRFFPGGMQAGGANYYFSYDHLGSVREVTNAAGAAVARYDYDPFGRLTINLGAPPKLGFAGYFYHSPSGLDLTMYRAYDPDLGRWASRDPLDLEGGLNLYAYVDDDPVDDLDPLGLKPCRDPFRPLKSTKRTKHGPNPPLCPGYVLGKCPPPAPVDPAPPHVPHIPPMSPMEGPPLPVWTPPVPLPEPSPTDPCHGNGPCFTGPNPLPNFNPRSTTDPRSLCFGVNPCDWLRPDCYACITPHEVEPDEPVHDPEDEGKDVPTLPGGAGR